MHQAQAAQHFFAKGVVVKGGDNDFTVIADDDIGNFSDPVQQNADLTAGVTGDISQLPGQVKSNDLSRRYPAAVEPLQGLQLAMF
jgi:hypothetical protein